MSPKEALEFAKQKEARQFDLRFTDLPGLSQHVSYPIAQLEEDSFEEGFGMDGSSIRGWAAINESDMLLIPDPSTAIHGSVRRDSHAGDDVRRHRSDHATALRARSALDREEGRDVSEEQRARPTPPIFGAEAEFFIFDNVRFDQNQHSGFYFIDAEEGPLEFGARERQPRLPAALQGRLFPGSADRSLSGSARRDGGDDDRVRARISSATITKSPPAASARSISASTRW